MDEFALIRMLNRPRAPGRGRLASGVAVGIGDDAAVVRAAQGRELVLSCDTMVENVHFKTVTMRFSDIGYKAMASSLSDMAAMGAEPRWALVALTVPRTAAAADLQALYDGLYECAERYGTAVVGGDTTSSSSGLVITVTAIGEAEAGRALLRSAAKPGDAVFVTGPLGGSAAGLHYLLARGEPADRANDIPPDVEALVRAHRRPEPRIAAGRLLLRSGRCGALNDVSDGLASEAWEIAEASGVRVLLHESQIPVPDEARAYAARSGRSALDWALYGGEDYELVGTVPQEHVAEVRGMFDAAGMPFYVVGAVAGPEAPEGVGVMLVTSGGERRPVGKKGYNHFA